TRRLVVIGTQAYFDLGNACTAEQFLGIDNSFLYLFIPLCVKDRISCPINATSGDETVHISLKLLQAS
ncbi:hypothetical protein A2U01_0111973, partial [Trifolium medium]|nr:hypothetical protein [Trifolium medium]